MRRASSFPHFLLAPALALALVGCSGAKSARQGADNAEAWTPPAELLRQTADPDADAPLRPTPTHDWDLLHTELDLKVDFRQQAVAGWATLSLTPHRYAQDTLPLDAKGLLVDTLQHQLPGGLWVNLPHRYDTATQRRIVRLPRPLQRGDTLILRLKYAAYTQQAAGPGSEAIAGDQGLYWIDPEGTDPYRPTQLWSQGQPEASSRWFPTLDRPNERQTHRLRITVPDSLMTVSNGVRVSSQTAANGWRTDLWTMDLPHAPYLVMLAVGHWRAVADQAGQLPLLYYVEPAYANHARTVFGRTPQMVAFFQDYFGKPFPWPNYKQVVVRDFVSGAMENTTATIHMDALQHDARSHLDRTYEEYISHELAHQWFGDLVTCESWGQTAMNEAFATYAEYLWLEHADGPDEAAVHLENDLNNYLLEAQRERHSLIRRRYEGPDDLFDAHSYQKGSRILHLLRQRVGDEAFRAGLRRYLDRHAFQPVEAHDLRLAMEAETGLDLLNYWDQWFFTPGHPVLNVAVEAANRKKGLRLRITQEQGELGLGAKVYTLRLPVDVVDGAGVRTHLVFELTTADTVFTAELTQDAAFVDVDPQAGLLVQWRDKMPYDHWATQWRLARGYAQKNEALVGAFAADDAKPKDLLPLLQGATLQDDFWAVRKRALELLATALAEVDAEDEPDLMLASLETLLTAAHADADARVRALAWEALNFAWPWGNVPEAYTKGDRAPAWERLRARLIRWNKLHLDDSSYATVAAALRVADRLDAQRATQAAAQRLHLDDAAVQATAALILLEHEAPHALDSAARVVRRLPHGGDAMELMSQLPPYLRGIPQAQAQNLLDALMHVGETATAWYMRLGAVRALTTLADAYPDVATWLRARQQTEPHPRVKGTINRALKAPEDAEKD